MMVSDLLESPQRNESLDDFMLADPKKNSAFLQMQLSRVKETIKSTPDFELVRTGDLHHGYVFLYTKKDMLIEYYVKYEARNWGWFPKTLTQCMLWKNPSSLFSQGITTEVFFTYLLPTFGAIMSDTQQTVAGQNFWRGRMIAARARGMVVGLLNTRSKQFSEFEGSSANDLDTWINGLATYGDGNTKKDLRFVILQA